MRNPKAIILFVIIVFGAVTSFFWANRGEAPPVSEQENEEAVTTTGQPDQDEGKTQSGDRLSNLRNRIAAAKSNRGDFEENEDIDPEQVFVSSPFENLPEEEREYIMYREKTIQKRYHELAPVALEELWQEQKQNNIWTKETETELLKKLEEPALKKTSLDNVDCRETLCKVVAYNEDEAAYQNFFMKGTESGPLDSPSYATRVELEGGRFKTTVFFSSRTNAKPFIDMRDKMLAYIEDEKKAEQKIAAEKKGRL